MFEIPIFAFAILLAISIVLLSVVSGLLLLAIVGVSTRMAAGVVMAVARTSNSPRRFL